MSGRECAYNFPEPDGHHPQLHGRGGRPHVHHWPDHLDHRPRQLCHRNHGGGADPICVDHFFTNVGCGSNHAGYGSDHSSNVSDPADTVSPASLLQREADWRHRPAWTIDQVIWPTCSNHLSRRNDNHHKEWRYDNRDHRHDNMWESSRAR